MQFITRTKQSGPTESVAVRIGWMGADCDIVCGSKVHGNSHARGVTRVPATGDVATADNAHYLDIELVSFTQIRVQVNRRHCGWLLQEQNREVVAGAAGDDEEMPDAMAPRVPVIQYKKDDATRVKNATCN